MLSRRDRERRRFARADTRPTVGRSRLMHNVDLSVRLVFAEVPPPHRWAVTVLFLAVAALFLAMAGRIAFG